MKEVIIKLTKDDIISEAKEMELTSQDMEKIEYRMKGILKYIDNKLWGCIEYYVWDFIRNTIKEFTKEEI